MPLNILIIGAGVGGPASALLLLKSNPDHQITVIERYPELRANGQQIDFRAQGIPMMRKLGLLDAVKAKTVGERGFEMYDRNGKRYASVEANTSGKGRQGFTSEYEIMRGDIVNLLYEESMKESEKARGKGGITYEFGKTMTGLTQDEAGVDVTFSDGNKGRYDLVIGADGQQSRTRQQMFGKEASDASFKFIGVYAAFYSIPPKPYDADFAKSMHIPGGRLIMTRPSKPDLTGVYLLSLPGPGTQSEKLEASLREPVEKQKEVWTKLFAGTGWQTDRLLQEMQTSDDFYSFSMAQVKLEHIVKGRVALIGDSGYVPSPATGMGSTLAVMGSYVLAGELARHHDDVPEALRAYDEVMRPYIAESHYLGPGFPWILFPKSSFAISMLYWFTWIVTMLRIDKLFSRLVPETSGSWSPPDYPELKLD